MSDAKNKLLLPQQRQQHTVNACPYKNQIHEIIPNTHTFTETGLLYIIYITNITTHETLTSSPRGWSDMTGAGPLWKKLSVKIEMFLEEYNNLTGRDINHHTNTLYDSSALLLFLNFLETNCHHFEVIVIYKCNLKALTLMKKQVKSTQSMHHQNISTLFIRLLLQTLQLFPGKQIQGCCLMMTCQNKSMFIDLLRITSSWYPGGLLFSDFVRFLLSRFLSQSHDIPVDTIKV